MVRSRGRPNQADIAAQLGVSISTVSRALANEVGISAQVRGEVLKAARSLGYRSRHTATAATSGRALALVPLSTAASAMSSFYVGILEGMRAAADNVGVELDVRLVNGPAVTLDVLERQLDLAQADAVLLAGIDAWDGLADWIQGRECAAVLVNGSDPGMRISSVAPANFYGAYRATQRLIDAGHRHILHYTYEHRPTIRQRRRGFEAAIADTPGAQGIVISAEQYSVPALLDAISSGEIAATAIFSWNDLAAVEMLEGLPRDFSIIGFDGIPIAELTTPRLSTMRVDREAIGVSAVQLLVEHMNGLAAVKHVEVGVREIAGGTIFELEPRMPS